MKSISTVLSLVALVTPGLAQVTIDLGTAASFGLLAVKGINNTGSSFVSGSLGTTGHDVQGFPPGIFTGSLEVQNAAAAQAQADFVAARDNIRTFVGEGFGEFQTLDGETFTPGVYNFIKELQVVGDITLSGAGQFFFTSGSHLILSNDVTVHLADGALATNVFWAPGDATIIGNNSVLPGTVMTDDRIQLNSSAVVNGQMFALSGIAIDNSIVSF